MHALGSVNTSDSVTHCIPSGLTERCFCISVLTYQTINKASRGPSPTHSRAAVSVCWWIQTMSARLNYFLSPLTPSRLRLQMIVIAVSLTWWLAVSDTFTSRDPDRTAYQLVPMSPCRYTAGKNRVYEYWFTNHNVHYKTVTSIHYHNMCFLLSH